MWWVYSNDYSLTLYFQVQFIKVHCTVNAKSAIKFFLKRSDCQQRGRELRMVKERKYYDDPEKKRQTDRKRYDDKKEFIEQYNRGNQTSHIPYHKAKYQTNPEVQLVYKMQILLKTYNIKS